jgi:hypothetical protein
LIAPLLAGDMGKLPSGLRDHFGPLGKGDEPKKR